MYWQKGCCRKVLVITFLLGFSTHWSSGMIAEEVKQLSAWLSPGVLGHTGGHWNMTQTPNVSSPEARGANFRVSRSGPSNPDEHTSTVYILHTAPCSKCQGTEEEGKCIKCKADPLSVTCKAIQIFTEVGHLAGEKQEHWKWWFFPGCVQGRMFAVRRQNNYNKKTTCQMCQIPTHSVDFSEALFLFPSRAIS